MKSRGRGLRCAVDMTLAVGDLLDERLLVCPVAVRCSRGDDGDRARNWVIHQNENSIGVVRVREDAQPRHLPLVVGHGLHRSWTLSDLLCWQESTVGIPNNEVSSLDGARHLVLRPFHCA